MSSFAQHTTDPSGAPVTIFFEEIVDTPEQQAAFREDDEAIKLLNKAMIDDGDEGEVRGDDAREHEEGDEC